MIIRPLTIMAERPTPSTPPGISLLPLSSWTIAPKSSSTITVTNNNKLNVNGIGSWNELIYTRFQPEESGTYTFYLSWNAPNGIDFWNSQSSSTYRQFGMWWES